MHLMFLRCNDMISICCKFKTSGLHVMFYYVNFFFLIYIYNIYIYNIKQGMTLNTGNTQLLTKIVNVYWTFKGSSYIDRLRLRLEVYL